MFGFFKKRPDVGAELVQARTDLRAAQAEHQRLLNETIEAGERVRAAGNRLSEARKRLLDEAEEWAAIEAEKGEGR